MDNGGVGRFADGRCPVSTRKGGGGGPLEPEGSSNPNVRISVGGGEEHRLYQEPRTKYRVPFTQEAPLPPPLPDKGGQPSLPPYLFVSVSSHKRADGNRESSTSSWLMMLHVALSAYGEYVQVHGYKYTCVCVCVYIGWYPLLIPLLCLLIPCVFAEATTSMRSRCFFSAGCWMGLYWNL